VNLLHLGSPTHFDPIGEESVQRRRSSLRLILLEEGEERVDDDDRHDGVGQCLHALARLQIGGEVRQQRRDPQQQGEEVGKLSEQLAPEGNPAGWRQLVRPKLPSASRRLVVAQALG
jgi:hypothetical protein